MTDTASDVVLAVIMLFPLVAYLLDGSFELAVFGGPQTTVTDGGFAAVTLAYLAVSAHALIKIHEANE